MEYALFLGCTIPARGRNYELSARKVAAKLGIELVDLESFICCGFPIKSADQRSSLILGAYNLTLARERQLDLCTLCSSCTSALTEAERQLAEEEDLRKEIGRPGISDDELLLRVLFPEEHVEATISAGPIEKDYPRGDKPVMALIHELTKQKELSHVQVQKEGFSLSMRRNAP